MRTVNVGINELHGKVLWLGYVGENEHTQIVLDCTPVFSEYPAAVPAVTVQPPYAQPYPAIVSRDGNNVVWFITDSDLIHCGKGEMQVTFTENGVVVKSRIVNVSIGRSIEPTGVVPEPIENWLVEANTALNAIPQTINDALEGAKESGEFDGFSPTATVSKIGDTATISITDKEGTTTAQVKDGAKGDPGTPGQDGFSPIATVTKSDDTATISITDKNGTTTATVKDGKDGTPGQDGYSPTATVTKSGSVATISITDENGTTTATVTDGQDGDTGATPVISIGTVSTLTPGSDATASMDTTDPAHPVLSLGIPEGEPGNATIDDTSTANNRVWSAQKVNGLLGAVPSGKTLQGQVSDLKSALSPMDSIFDSYIFTGNYPSAMTWSHGTIGNTGIDNSIKYRIYTKNIIRLATDIHIYAVSGFRFTIQKYENDGTYISGTGWRTDEIIEQGTNVRFVIGRTTEESSEIADIITFTNGIKIDNPYSLYLSSVDNCIIDSAKQLSLTKHKLSTANGSRTADVNERCTDFIPVKAGNKIKVQLYGVINNNPWNRAICFYTSNKTFLSSPSLTFYAAAFNGGYIETQEITVPDNAEYVMVSLRTYGNTYSIAIDARVNPFSALSIGNGAFVATKQKAFLNGCIPILHAGGYSGVYNENTVNNMMYNILNADDGDKYKIAEVDVKCCSDLVWVVTHDQTFIHDSTTYTIKDTPSSIAVEAGLPLAEPFIKLAHQFGFGIMWDIGGGIYTDAQLYSIVDLTAKYNMIPFTFIASGTRNDLWKLASYCPQANLAFIKFAKLLASDTTQMIALNNIMTGCLMMYLEKNTAITLDEQSYIDGYREKGMAFGIHGFRNADSAVLKDWAKICDYLCVPQRNAYELMRVYDFE